MYAPLDTLRVLISVDFMCKFLEPVSLESKLNIRLSDVYARIQLNSHRDLQVNEDRKGEAT